jgi:predicted nucleic acid-binding protein
MTKVLDAWAVLAWIQNEQPAATRVRQLLVEQSEGRLDLAMNVINVGEVYYRLYRLRGAEFADSFIAELDNRVRSVDAPNWLVLEAARYKGRHRISYADAFAVATAIRERAPLVTGDPDFEAFHDDQTVRIEWLKTS